MTPWCLTCVTGRVELLFAKMRKTVRRASLRDCQGFRFGQGRFDMPIGPFDEGRFHRATLARGLDW